MGQLIVTLASNGGWGFGRVIGYDPQLENCGDLEFLLQGSQVLIIFHNEPSAVVPQVQLAAKFSKPAVVGTTGLTDEMVNELRELSQSVPVVVASNFSLGINLLPPVLELLCRMIPTHWSIEIVDEHHGRKLDAPSGTAMTLAKFIQGNRGGKVECGRSGRASGVRPENLIGVQAVRAGDIPGNHEIILAGDGQVLRVRHEVYSPEVFAKAALQVARQVVDLVPGMYSPADVLWGCRL
jgi:4-hydroxy-tetrahydrodipicolinate reductase